MGTREQSDRPHSFLHDRYLHTFTVLVHKPTFHGYSMLLTCDASLSPLPPGQRPADIMESGHSIGGLGPHRVRNAPKMRRRHRTKQHFAFSPSFPSSSSSVIPSSSSLTTSYTLLPSPFSPTAFFSDDGVCRGLCAALQRLPPGPPHPGPRPLLPHWCA